MNNEIDRTSLLDLLSLRRKNKESKTYIEILLVPILACIILTVILSALIVHTVTYGGITKSTVKREKLEGAVSEPTFTDDEEMVSDRDFLQRKLNEFMQKTGVTPYAYIYANNTRETAEDLYSKYCTAEDCFFVTFNANTGSINAFISGKADCVIDGEAYTIFGDYFRYYKSIVDEPEKLLGYAYKATADRIMTKTNIFNCVSVEYYIGIVVIAIMELFFIYKTVKSISDKLNKKNEQENDYGKLQ